ncbi:RrF2 family transcriptional regulator [Sphingomonas sp.]|uniref:RrF2 family transcriptional regulator n=1 Tax=Sphingomonas sp. TaxID=28214 RepID=UPI003D6D5F56
MAHLTVSVEYGIHGLLWLVGSDEPLSSRDIAELQGISHSFLAKIFPRLEKAGIVRASEGVRGGYLLARSPDDISFLDIVDAIEGRKPLFDCQDVRTRCALFGDAPPAWATSGVCAVHVVMLQAEKAMRDTLAGQSLGDVARSFATAASPDFFPQVRNWLGERVGHRVRNARRGRSPASKRESPE